MEEQRKPRTARKILEELRSDPEWLAREEYLERRRLAWSKVLLANGAPIVRDLRRAGLRVETVADLFSPREPWRGDETLPVYTHAIPILVDHLRRDYLFEVRNSIIRALLGRDARSAFPALVEEFRRTGRRGAPKQLLQRETDVLMEGVSGLMDRDEVERILRARWEDYVFVLARAVARHFDRRRDLPEIVSLLEDDGLTEEHRRELATWVAARAKRWKQVPPELQRALERLLPPDQVPRGRT